MDHDQTPPGARTSAASSPPRRWLTPALAGALGAASLALAVVGLGVGGAGAEDSPVLADRAVAVGEPQVFGALIAPDDLEDLDELDPGEFDEFDAAFEAFEACMDERLGDVDFEVADGAELDEVFEAAEAACEDLLPEDVRAEIAAFEPFEACIGEAEAGFGDIESGIVWLDSADGSQAIQFSDTPGSVTIVGDASGVEIASSDGVIVLDEADLDDLFAGQDAAFEACEDLLPEDGYFEHGDFGHGDSDDGDPDDATEDDEG